MKISIGIMLWNEEESIEMMIDSLFAQTLFNTPIDRISSIQILALANGCTDKSVPITKACFKKHLEKCTLPNIHAEVVELKLRGRSNAWNAFVHELTPSDVKYLFLMDADISINAKKTLENMIVGLEDHPECHVASALGIKDIELTGRPNLFEQLTLHITKLEQNARLTFLCGGLYAGRTEFFRNFMFPAGFVCGDDGFIVTLATTNFCTTNHEFHRVYATPDATFVFEAYSSLSTLFRQHVRREIGAIVRSMVVSYINDEIAKKGGNAGEILLQASRNDPEWLLKYQESEFNRRGFWVIPIRRLKYRFSQLRGKSFSYKIQKIPIVLIGTIWLAGVILSANRKILKKEHLTVWLSNPNTRMISNKID